MDSSNTTPGRVFAILLALLPTLAVMAPVQMPYFLAIGGVVGLVCAFGQARLLGRRWPVEWDPMLIGLLFALALYGGISALWSLDAEASLGLALRLSLLFLAAIGFASLLRQATGARRVRHGALAGLAVGAIVLAIELISGGAIREITESLLGLERMAPRTVLEQRSEYSRAAPIAVLMLWPLVSFAGIGGRLDSWRDKVAWIFVASGATALAIAFIPIGAAKVAFLVAVGATALSFLLGGRRVLLLIAATTILLGLASPFIATRLGSPAVMHHLVDRDSPIAPRGGYSMMHRLKIWEFAATRALERPVLGWGLDAARRIPGGQDRIRPSDLGIPEQRFLPDILNRMQIKRKNDFQLRNLRLHPHNAALQVWLELGLIGVILVCAIVGRAIWLAAATGNWQAVPVAAGGVVLASLSFGVWQGWWVATLLVAACLALNASTRVSSS